MGQVRSCGFKFEVCATLSVVLTGEPEFKILLIEQLTTALKRTAARFDIVFLVIISLIHLNAFDQTF